MMIRGSRTLAREVSRRTRLYYNWIRISKTHISDSRERKINYVFLPGEHAHDAPHQDSAQHHGEEAQDGQDVLNILGKLLVSNFKTNIIGKADFVVQFLVSSFGKFICVIKKK